MKDCPAVLKTLGLLVIGFLLVILAVSLTIRGQNSTNSTVVRVDRIQGVNPTEMFVEDEFIVVLKRGPRAGFRVGRGPSNTPSVNVASLQQLIARHSVGRFKRQFPGSKTQPGGSTLPDLSGHYKVRIPRGVNLEAALADFAGDPSVDHVEKIGIHPLFMTPNDSFYADQWNLRSPNGIDADLGWNTKAGSSDVVVAVLDTGVRYNHADLKGNIWVNPREIPNNGIDDDGNGFIDDVVGYDFMEDASGAALYTCCDSDCSIADNDPSDHNGHGTHLAGIVAATTNNGFGVAGIAGGYSDGTFQSTANGIKIMPLRIGWDGSFLGLVCGTGLIRMDYAAEALHYVALQKASGVNIAAVNCSWGSSDSGGLGAAVDEVLANDVMIVHAAGNSSSSTADFLGTKPGVMNVAATDQNGNGASFTNYGDWVSLSAPGVDITSLWVGPDPNTEYFATASGTSMAAPHATGVAALLESMNPALTGPQKFDLMVSNTKPYVKDSRNLGSGILNTSLALGALGPAPPDFILTASPNTRTVVVGTATSVNMTVNPLAGFNAMVSFTASGLPAGANSDFSPLFVLGSGLSTMTVTTAITTPPGNYPVTVTATGGNLSHSIKVTLQIYIPGTATFVKTDTATQGTWKGVYGGQGVAIANDVTNYPAYAQVTLNNQSNFTWTSSTTDVRALQKGANTDRIASTWYSPTSFDIDINLTDGNWHQVGLYCLDWGTNNERIQRIDVLDAVGGGVLDTRSLSAFSNGQYLIWNLKGHVNIRTTRTGAYNAVVSGIFFDLPAPPDFNLSTTPNSQSVAVGGSVSYNLTVTPSAGFSGIVSLSATGLPAGATASFNPTSVTGSGTSTLTVTTGITTPGGSYPLRITGTSGGLNHSTSATFVVRVSVPAAVTFIKTDTKTQGTWKGVYGTGGYVIADDSTNYPAYAQVSFANQSDFVWVGSTTDVRALQKGAAADRIASTWYSGSSFNIDVNLTDGNWHQVGVYCLDWGTNNERLQTIDVLDGVGGGVLDSRSVSVFSNGKYLIWNLKGHVVIRASKAGPYNAVVSGVFFDLPAPPDFFVSASPSSQSVTLASSTSYNITVNPLAGFNGTVNLSASGLPTGTTASFNPTSVTGSGTSRLTVTTGMTTPGGSYPLMINGASGSVNHSATVTMVVTVSIPAAVAFIKTDTATQGTWKGVYGTEGYAIAKDSTNYPTYAQVSFANQSDFVWAASTTDVRALQKAATADRIASTWYSASSFNIDVNLTDGNWHQVGLYCLDWGTNNERIETIDILDAVGGGVLDSRSLSAFSNGKYLIWNLKGHANIRITRIGAYNGVVNGLFFK